MVKVKQSFIYVLAIVSILGFSTTLLEGFDVVDIGDYVTSAIYIVIGFGLLIEGNIKALPKMLKDGLTSDEMTHVLAMLIGLMSIVVGVYSLPQLMVELPIFIGIRSVVSALAITIIIIETWLVK